MVLTAAAAMLTLLLMPQHSALAGGVSFDPDSPAGKEYALPLDQARDEAAGVGKADGPAGEKAPLFGEGVSGSSGGEEGRRPGADRAAGPAGNGAAGQGNVRAQGTQAAAAGGGDGYALSSAILWVAAIVALGGIAGLVFRVLQRPRII
jgi:hypothetical protein